MIKMDFLVHKLPLRVRLRSSSPLDTKVIAPNTLLSSLSTFSFVAYNIALVSLFLSILAPKIAAPRNAKISQNKPQNQPKHIKQNGKLSRKIIITTHLLQHLPLKP